MRTISSLAVLLSFTLTAVADDKTVGDLPKEKWDTSYLEKRFNLMLKSVKCSKGSSETEFELLLEFTKDTDARTLAQELLGGGKPSFKLVLLDVENVQFYSSMVFKKSAGEVSGVNGEAFKMKVTIPTETVEKASRATVRDLIDSAKGSGTSK